MMSSTSFVGQFTKSLVPSPPAHPSQLQLAQVQDTQVKQQLRSILFHLLRPLQTQDLRNAVQDFLLLHNDTTFSSNDVEELELRIEVLGRLTVAIYARALDSSLIQATEAEGEAEWWADIERSPQKVAFYFLQTLPSRIYNLLLAVSWPIQRQNLSPGVSRISVTRLPNLFPTLPPTHPGTLTTIFFPHIHQQPHAYTTSPTYLFLTGRKTSATNLRGLYHRSVSTLKWLFTLTGLPFLLSQQECHSRRKELERLRDERAELLGALAQLRGQLELALCGNPELLDTFLQALFSVISAKKDVPGIPIPLMVLALNAIEVQAEQHRQYIVGQSLRKPSRLTLLWPKILLLPPLAFYSVRHLYASRATLKQFGKDAIEIVEGFFTGWLIEPLKGVLRTVRAGGEDGMLIHHGGVTADLESLERMTVALAREKLNYSDLQLAALSSKIRSGDITPVMEVYEGDIRQPLRSAITGTLLRSLFIQIQKAKVDINQALTGIDRLLKSQELTFAFVGVAPALVVVYQLGSYISRVWTGGKGRGRYGGTRRRIGVWSAMRRIERLLVVSQTRDEALATSNGSTSPLSPLTNGLVLLSVARLRSYAELYLPQKSRLQQGFLEDVEDLENPDLGREQKLKVIERMWRCWGNAFGWGDAANRGGGVSARLGLVAM